MISKIRTMDVALQEMKSFLRKLECKQAHIELDNMKIQKHITTLRDSLEGVKEIKDKIDQMSKNNLEQEKLIKDLKVQILKLKKKHKNETMHTESYSKDFNRALEIDMSPKVYDKKTSNMMKVMESKFLLPEAETEYAETHKRQEVKKDLGNSYRNSYSTIKSGHSDYSYVFHTVDEHILDRYLKDSAKFHDDVAPDEEKEPSEDSPAQESENESDRGDDNFQTVPEFRNSNVKTDSQFRSLAESHDSTRSKLSQSREKKSKKNLSKKSRRRIARNNHLPHCKSRGEKSLKIYDSKNCSDHCSVREVFRNRRKR